MLAKKVFAIFSNAKGQVVSIFSLCRSLKDVVKRINILLLLYAMERVGWERLDVVGATHVLERGSLTRGMCSAYMQQSAHSCPGERKPDAGHEFGLYVIINAYVTINASTILLHISKWAQRSALLLLYAMKRE